ncbi:MAG: hypothetical protein NTU76_03515 [Candidatus Taylorbacteria bacterium]|nr:hypothetical protein [Candidatus Taylorbacteria bacterium]
MKPQNMLNFLFITAVFLFGFSAVTFAESSTSTGQINAEILSNIWYSTTTVNENDIINIYAGFQNHSIKNLSGTAGFFIDDIQISKMNFVASPKSLIKLQSEYKAVRGDHTSQVKILDIVEIGGSILNKLSTENLLAKETEKNSLKVEYKITKEEVVKIAGNVASNVIKVIDTQAEKLADYVESLKDKTTETSESSSVSKTSEQIAQEKLTGKVLGISDENTTDTQNEGQDSQTNKKFSFYNMFLDILAFLLRHWIWVLVVVIILVVYLAFR